MTPTTAVTPECMLAELAAFVIGLVVCALSVQIAIYFVYGEKVGIVRYLCKKFSR